MHGWVVATQQQQAGRRPRLLPACAACDCRLMAGARLRFYTRARAGPRPGGDPGRPDRRLGGGRAQGCRGAGGRAALRTGKETRAGRRLPPLLPASRAALPAPAAGPPERCRAAHQLRHLHPALHTAWPLQPSACSSSACCRTSAHPRGCACRCCRVRRPGRGRGQGWARWGRGRLGRLLLEGERRCAACSRTLCACCPTLRRRRTRGRRGPVSARSRLPQGAAGLRSPPTPRLCTWRPVARCRALIAAVTLHRYSVAS